MQLACAKLWCSWHDRQCFSACIGLNVSKEERRKDFQKHFAPRHKRSRLKNGDKADGQIRARVHIPLKKASAIEGRRRPISPQLEMFSHI